MRKAKKAVSLLVLLALAAGLLPSFPSVSEAAPLSSLAACEAAYDAMFPGQNPPNGIRCVKRTGSSPSVYLFFNYKLYADTLAAGEPVLAYGTPEAANGPADFRTYWKDKSGNKRTDRAGIHPYFNKGSEPGEYRYYGWDVNGNLYTNPYFPDDKNSGVDPSLKKYIYRPWSSPLLAGNRNKPNDFGPFWMGTNLIDRIDQIYGKGKDFIATVNKIIKSSQVTVKYQAKDVVTDPNNPKNLFDYMYVQQAPTSQLPGSGRLFHQNDNGSVWYQTYPIDRLGPGDKEKPGVTAEIKPKPEIKTTDLGKLGPTFTWSWELSGKVNDDAYVDDSFEKARYYTRFDIEKWELDVTYSWPGGSKSETLLSTKNGDLVLQNHRQKALRSPDLSVTFDKSKVKKNDQVTITLTAKAYYYNNPSPDVGSTTWTIKFDGTPPVPAPRSSPLPPPEEGPPPLACKPNIPDDAFDIVPFPASDETDLSRIASRSVWVDGVPVDAEQFFSGNYVFGDDKDGLVTVTMKWEPLPGEDANGADMCDTYRIVNVHDTKPRAQFKLYGGSFKENRKMAVENTSNDPNANDPFVLAAYPLVDAKWTWRAVDGSDSDRRMKVDGRDRKEFLYKKAGEYELTLTVTNALGRTSDPYVLKFTVVPDYAPAVILHPYSSQISRAEPLSLFYDAVSTDGDIIRNQQIEVFYDVNGDGTYAQKIDSFTGPVTEYVPKGGKLGKYRIVAKVDEDFGQETFPEFITEADRRVTVAEMEFEVDNYIPYSDIYTDIPSIRQQVDTAILLDKNLAQSKIDDVKSSGVEINNQMRYYGMDPNLYVWDMHTYTYSQPASTVVHTGSYPPGTYSYCAGGYCGTLTLQSASDNGSYHDYGHYETVVDVPGHYETEVDVPGHYETRYRTEQWCKGYSDSGIFYDHPGSCTSSNSTPYTKSIPYQVWVDTTYKQVWIPTTYKQVWVPDVRWVSNWYGTYAGVISKDVRQPYQNPFARAVADKYIVYVSDGGISELADFNKVKGVSDAKIVLIGAAAIRNQTEYDHFIENKGEDIRTLIDKAIAWIASQSPPAASQTVLIGQTFNLLTDETDPENDPIAQRQTMYVHDENYYDNPMGHADFALREYDTDGWTDEALRNRFDLPGEYIIYRRVKDRPSDDPALQSYAYWSNESFTVIRAHRKPIARAELDWTYDTACGCYDTTWVDQSYDLDHNISDPVSKGIVERKIRYQRDGGEWFYKIPDQLEPGTYHLEYLVRDVEGAWSDPFMMDFTLAAAPPPQLKAELRAEDSAFTIAGGVPASESVRAYNLWTRFPYNVDLQFLMDVSGSILNRTVRYYTGTKKGSEIFWNDEVLAIPPTTPDGNYTFRVRANGSNGTSAFKDFNLRVLTPINLSGQIDQSGTSDINKVAAGYPLTVRATTTEYPNQVTVILLKGTPYQRSLTLSGTVTNANGVGSKAWSANTTLTGVPDGNYVVEWTARTPNGNVQTVTKTIQIVNNRPPVANFDWTPKPPYEGDTITLINQSSDPDGDPLTYQWTVGGPNGYSRSGTSRDFTIPGADTKNRTGTYTVTLTVRDPKGASSSISKTVSVLPLGITGTVTHTSAWQEKIDRFNRGLRPTDEDYRQPDEFWAGEAFVLHADTTDTGTSTVATKVEVTADGSAIPYWWNGKMIKETLSPDNAAKSKWSGKITDHSVTYTGDNNRLENLQNGYLDIEFKVTYSNGVIKTDTVRVYVRNKWTEFYQIHRVQ
ncbi:PKD domain-containing protein [Cohnella thermotolerans]|uniref:PKD domain-containing protein n=1 Tax=Cohnella thermotolerans TaxID=329858 RepID=UPI00146FB14A|nr:PKD domain-containing protein [Cohnella thermotolerans]